MKTIPLTKVETHLSTILKEVETGKEIAISSIKKKKKETIAVIVPYKTYLKSKKRMLGSLKGKVSVEFKPGFKMTDKEFLRS